MDNDYGLDLDEVMRVIGSADVLILRFVVVQQRLLLDARASDLEGPLLKLVPRVSSARERFRDLKQARPRFPLPDRITAIAWPRFVETLVSSGVWAQIERRLDVPAFPQAGQQAAAVLEELRRLERTEIRNAIRGEGYQTYWERKP
jgi:hypothetical protein